MKRKFKNVMITIILLLHATFSYAHWDSAYYRNEDDGFTKKIDWMKNIKDETRLSEMALPGTHDSATFSADKFKNIAMTQTLNLTQQLEYGIRVLDLRIRQTGNSFALHHGNLFLNNMFGDALTKIDNFLNKHPSETILIRLKEDHAPDTNNTKTLQQTLKHYLDLHKKHYLNASSDITMKKARGKFIILSNNLEFDKYGIDYSFFDIQDKYNLKTNWQLYSKWESVKAQLHNAYLGSKDKFYVNFLSGSVGVFPYFVASGHSSSSTAAPRLATGLTTPGWQSSYPDFPRIDCFVGICTIAFEGINVLTRDALLNINLSSFYKTSNLISTFIGAIIGMHSLNITNMRTVGIIMADFPGESLISEIIRNNQFHMINKPQFAPININKLNKITNDSEEALKKMQKEDPELYAQLSKTVINE